MATESNKNLAKKWMSLFEESYRRMEQEFFDKWKKSIIEYRKHVAHVEDAGGGLDGGELFPDGTAKTALVFSTIRTIMPKLTTGNPFIRVIPDSPQDRQIDWRSFEIAVNKSLRMTKFGRTIKSQVLDSLLCGVGYIRMYAPEHDDYLFPEESLAAQSDLDIVPDIMRNFVEITEEEALNKQDVFGDLRVASIKESQLASNNVSDYRKFLPKFKRISPFHVVFPKNSTSLDTAAWIAHVIPTTLVDIQNDSRYKKEDLEGLERLAIDGDGNIIIGDSDNKDVARTYERSRGSKVLFKVEIFIRTDPFRNKKNDNSGRIIHFVMGHDSIILNVKNQYKDQIIPIFDLQFNKMDDFPIGISEVSAMSTDVARIAAIEAAMSKHFTTWHAGKLLVGSGASIDDAEKEKLTNDEHGLVVEVNGPVDQVVPFIPSNTPPDWFNQRGTLRQNVQEDVGLDAFQRGSAVKDISASQTAVIDRNATARIEEKLQEIIEMISDIMQPYSEILTTFVEEIFIDVNGEISALQMRSFKDNTFLYSVDPLTMKPGSSPEEVLSYTQFMKIVSNAPMFQGMIDWKKFLDQMAYSMGLPVNIIKSSEEIEAALQQLQLQELANSVGDGGAERQGGIEGLPESGDKPVAASPESGTGENSSPLASALSGARRV